MRARALILAVVVAFATTAVAQAAWKDAGATTHATFTAAAEFPPLVSLVPSLLGTAQVGVAMHATGGAFSPAATGATITWLRCDALGAACVATGSTGADYTVQVADLAKTLRAELTPANGATSGAAVRSEPSPPVIGLNLGPLLKTPLVDNTPTVTGTTAVGATLTALPGTWSSVAVTFSYQWLRCDAVGAGCAAIAGATGQTYVPVVADRGVRLSVKVTGALLGLVPSPALGTTTAVIA
jgi:hypothetical protein